jgi:hypothetical protein
MKWGHLVLGILLIFACIWASNNVTVIENIVG